MQKYLLNLTRREKQLSVIGLDITIALLSTWLAFSIRLETLHLPESEEWIIYWVSPIIAIPVFIRSGLYRAIFRYSGLDALRATGKALLVYTFIHLIALIIWQWPVFPVTLGVLQPIIFVLMVGISRGFARFWLTKNLTANTSNDGKMLIYGAGTVGVQTASAMSVAGNLVLLGFIDDDTHKVGQTIDGIPVFSPADLPRVVKKYNISDILLAIPSATRDHRNRIIRSLQSLPVHTRTLPGLADIASGRVTVKDFQELDIDDLLSRDVVQSQAYSVVALIKNQSILVSGAGGSIGSELCRQILQAVPKRLILLEHSEFALYTLHRELLAACSTQNLPTELVPILASVRNKHRLAKIFSLYQPDTVYHTAAYKHVPMVECNPSEGIMNNVFGSLNIAEVAITAKVSNFVLISTDKAVRPTNLMGASKRMAELVMQALAKQQLAGGTCFSMVRFGNVLGSSGSVIPLFRDQIAHGGPITVTHAEITRFFMTIPEAVQLVLQASIMAKGGEVFVLEMGEPVKIVDLAYRLISLSGLQVRDYMHPDGDIEIKFIGLRPGEKLYEELLIGGDPTPTQHPRIMKAHEAYLDWADLSAQLTILQQAAVDEDVDVIKAVLRHCVVGFNEQLF